MVFECQSTWNWDDFDELVSKYPFLKEYNVRPVEKESFNGTRYKRIEIDVNTLEELLELSKKAEQPLVINSREPSIEIHDSYRE